MITIRIEMVQYRTLLLYKSSTNCHAYLFYGCNDIKQKKIINCAISRIYFMMQDINSWNKLEKLNVKLLTRRAKPVNLLWFTGKAFTTPVVPQLALITADTVLTTFNFIGLKA